MSTYDENTLFLNELNTDQTGCMNWNVRARKYFISTVFTFLLIKAARGLLFHLARTGYTLKEAETSQLKQLYIVCEDCTAHVHKYFNGHCPLTSPQRCEVPAT